MLLADVHLNDWHGEPPHFRQRENRIKVASLRAGYTPLAVIGFDASGVGAQPATALLAARHDWEWYGSPTVEVRA